MSETLLVAGFVVYWVAWALIVERTVGLREFALFDPRRGTYSRWWGGWMLVALVLSGLVAYVGIRTAEPLVFVGLLLVINTVYTAWAVPFAARRLGVRR